MSSLLGWQLHQGSFQSFLLKISHMVLYIYFKHTQTCSAGLLWSHAAQFSERSPGENLLLPSENKSETRLKSSQLKRLFLTSILQTHKVSEQNSRSQCGCCRFSRSKREGNGSKLMGITTVSGEKHHGPTNCSWPTSHLAVEGPALS